MNMYGTNQNEEKRKIDSHALDAEVLSSRFASDKRNFMYMKIDGEIL